MFVEYMQGKDRTIRLIDLCLDPEICARAEYSPLKDLLTLDETDPEIQAKSVAYTYAFRKLIRMPPDTLDRSNINRNEPHSPEWNKTALIKLIETMPFRVGFLVKVLLNDAPAVVSTFPKERTPEAYLTIANSNYVAALRALDSLSENREISRFITYQLLFPISPSSIIAHYYPLIGSEEDSAFIVSIGNSAIYSREVLWLSKQFLENGAWKDVPYDDVLMLELGGLLSVVGRFNPNEIKQAQIELVKLAKSKGLSQNDVARAFDEFAEGIPPGVEGMRNVLSFLPSNLGLLTQDQATAILDKVISLHPSRNQKYLIGEMISDCYQLEMVDEEGKDY